MGLPRHADSRLSNDQIVAQLANFSSTMRSRSGISRCHIHVNDTRLKKHHLLGCCVLAMLAAQAVVRTVVNGTLAARVRVMVGAPRQRVLPVHAAAAPHASGSELHLCGLQSAQPVAQLRASARTASTAGIDDATYTCNLCNNIRPREAMRKRSGTRCKECTGKLKRLCRSGHSVADAALHDGSGDKVCARRYDKKMREQQHDIKCVDLVLTYI